MSHGQIKSWYTTSLYQTLKLFCLMVIGAFFFLIEPKFVRGHKPLIVTVAFLAYSTKAERGKVHTRKD